MIDADGIWHFCMAPRDVWTELDKYQAQYYVEHGLASDLSRSVLEQLLVSRKLAVLPKLLLALDR